MKLSKEAHQQAALVEAERALIGALVNLGGDGLEAQQAAFNAIKPYSIADVYNPTNQSLYSSVSGMIAEGELCTVQLLYARLVDRGVIDYIGGLGAIASICKEAFSFSSLDAVKALSNQLLEESRRRKAWQLTTVIQQAEADNRPLDDALSDAQAIIDKLRSAKGHGDATKKNRIVNLFDAISDIKPRQWLIKNIMARMEVVFLHGAPKAGKSFIAIDWALSIATGRPWHGHEIKDAGAVLYVSGEGNDNITKRFKGWLDYHDVDISFAKNVMLTKRAYKLPTEVDAIVRDVDSAMQDYGYPSVKVIFLDTYRRILEGNEDSNVDAGVFFDAAAKIQDRYQCAVVIVHHSNRSESARMTGASTLPANADSIFGLSGSVANVGTVTLSNTHTKDSAPHADMHFQYASIELEGVLADADYPILGFETTLVPVQVELSGNVITKSARLSGKQSEAYQILLDMQAEASTKPETRFNAEEEPIILVDDWLRRCVIKGLGSEPSKVKRDILKKLEAKHVVIVRDNLYIFTAVSEPIAPDYTAGFD